MPDVNILQHIHSAKHKNISKKKEKLLAQIMSI